MLQIAECWNINKEAGEMRCIKDNNNYIEHSRPLQ